MKGDVLARQSNIELLRILTMMGVIILHYNKNSSGGGITVADGINLFVLCFLECICICAVNLFVLITGYYMCTNNKRSLLKPMKLIIQVMLFACALYILDVLMGSRAFSWISLIRSLVPANYFVILYVVLYFVSPYVNKVVISLDKKQLKRMLIMLILLFSVWPTLVDFSEVVLGRPWLGLSSIGMEGSQAGYTIVNFILMYIVGAYIRVTENTRKKEANQRLLLQFLICTLVILIWYFWNTSAVEYCNPLVIMQAFLLFKMFRNIPLNPNRAINEIAKGAFTVYLVHGAVVLRINYQKYVTNGLALMLIHMFITVLGIYFVCWIIYELYEKCSSLVCKFILYNFPIFEKDLLGLCEREEADD